MKTRASKIFFLCLFVILAALVFSLLSVLSPTLSAENDEISTAENTVESIRVGIKVGENIVDEYRFSSSKRLELGCMDMSDGSFTFFEETGPGSFSVHSESGAYRVEVLSVTPDGGEPFTRGEIYAFLKDGSDGFSVFTSYSEDEENGLFVPVVCVGDFDSPEKAEEYAEGLRTGRSVNAVCTVVPYTENELVMTDLSSDILVCFSQSGISSEYAFAARPSDHAENGYLTAGFNPTAVSGGVDSRYGEKYEGTLEFRIYGKKDVDGIEVINILPTERYVMAVMSREISPSHPLEVQKAFAITVRTFTYRSLNRHRSEYFNLCASSSCCDAYRGCSRIGTNVIRGASATEGKVLKTPGGSLAHVYFSANSGGCSVCAHESWQSSVYTYMQAMPSPWEEYGNDSSGMTKWSVEYTPEELYERIKDYNPSTVIRGSISSVTTTLCTDSPHVYSATFTDIYGNSETYSLASRVRALLGLNSSNFVVGKGGETVRRNVYVLDCFDSIYSEDFSLDDILKSAENIYAAVNGGSVLLDNSITRKIATSSGLIDAKLSDGTFNVITSGGIRRLQTSADPTLPDILNAGIVMKTTDVTLSGDSGNFIFDGIGWGHGIGIPQDGLVDLISYGYDYETALRYYLRGIEIVGANEL